MAQNDTHSYHSHLRSGSPYNHLPYSSKSHGSAKKNLLIYDADLKFWQRRYEGSLGKSGLPKYLRKINESLNSVTDILNAAHQKKGNVRITWEERDARITDKIFELDTLVMRAVDNGRLDNESAQAILQSARDKITLRFNEDRYVKERKLSSKYMRTAHELLECRIRSYLPKSSRAQAEPRSSLATIPEPELAHKAPVISVTVLEPEPVSPVSERPPSIAKPSARPAAQTLEARIAEPAQSEHSSQSSAEKPAEGPTVRYKIPIPPAPPGEAWGETIKREARLLFGDTIQVETYDPYTTDEAPWKSIKPSLPPEPRSWFSRNFAKATMAAAASLVFAGVGVSYACGIDVSEKIASFLSSSRVSLTNSPMRLK